MKIEILQAGRYNDARHKVHKLAIGDELETGEAYGNSLIAAGLASLISPDAVGAEPEPEPATDGAESPAAGAEAGTVATTPARMGGGRKSGATKSAAKKAARK